MEVKLFSDETDRLENNVSVTLDAFEYTHGVAISAVLACEAYAQFEPPANVAAQIIVAIRAALYNATEGEAFDTIAAIVADHYDIQGEAEREAAYEADHQRMLYSMRRD